MPKVHHRPPQTVPERVMTPLHRETASNGQQVKEIPTCPGQVRSNLRTYASVKSVELDLSLTVEK